MASHIQEGVDNLSTALSSVAKLSPQIRLAQAISEFGALFADDATKHARFKNLRNRSPPTAGEVVQLTEEVNSDGSRRHKSWKPFATRIVLVLERVQQFAPIGDVLTGGAQTMLASGVWASLRMALEISVGFLSYFDKVSTLLLRIGRCVSLHQDFALLFPQCRQIQGFMCEYTIVIVQICTQIVVYARKSFATQLASSFLSPFDTVFKPLEDQLLGWGRLIERRAQIMAVKLSQERESSNVARYNWFLMFFTKQAEEARSRDRESRKHRFLTGLSPYQREFDSIWRRERRRGDSQWILKHPQYEQWLGSSNSSVLWLQGNLGSGKSVTMASIAASLVTPDKQKHEALRTVSFFFCTKTADKTLKRRNIIGSLTCQILRHENITPSLLTFLDNENESIDTLASMDHVDLLLAITPRDWRGVFILDGLDEVPQQEVRELFLDLQRLLESRNMLLCCSARSNSICKSTVEAMVPVESTISMEAEDRLADFEAYISAEVERWKTIRPLPSEIEQLIIKQLLVGCQGMFLWLALQMEAICSGHTQELRSDSSILSILDNLPRNLPEAFDQALSRISDERYGSRALQLVAVADSPLSSDELRVAINVEPGNLAWTSSTIISSSTSLAFHCGGSLLEIDEEDLCVRLIHHSVFLHLTNPPALAAAAPFHFELSEAEIYLAAICVTYLSYDIFENQLSRTQNMPLANVPDKVQDSVLKPNTIMRKVLSLLMRSGKRTNSANINVERLLHDLKSYGSKTGDEVYLFLPYATKHWLDSTKCLANPFQPAVHALWTRLVDGIAGSTLESLPWTPGSIACATTWAICEQHKLLLRHQLCNPYESKLRQAANSSMSILRDRSKMSQWSNEETDWSSNPPICLSGEGLGNLAPTYLRSAYARGDLIATDVEILVRIGCLPWASGSSYQYFDDPISAKADLDTIAKEIIPKILLPTPGPLHVRCVIFLAHYLQNVNEPLANGLTLLEEFITRGMGKPAQALLERLNADPNRPRRPGMPSPLQLCLRQKNYDLAALLIDRGADVMDDQDGGLPPFLKIIGEQNMSLFHHAKTMHFKYRSRKYGEEQETAFQFACRIHDDWGLSRSNSFRILQGLLENGASLSSPDRHGHMPLFSSILRRNSTLSDWLLQAGANPNEPKLGAALPLHVATGDDVRKLLKAGAHANPSNKYGITPLMVASFCADHVAVEALVGAGALVQTRIHISVTVQGLYSDQARAILSRSFLSEHTPGFPDEVMARLDDLASHIEPGDTAPMLVIRHLEFLQREINLRIVGTGGRLSGRLPPHWKPTFQIILRTLTRAAGEDLKKELREYVKRYKGTSFGLSLMKAVGED